MSSMSRGKPQKAFKVVKPKKSTKRTTASTKNFRWQSFNERIANLKIDPIRRKRYVDEEEEALDTTHTYLGESLEQWKDRNLSATFTAFAKDVSPLCDNLVVVLHNEVAIMDHFAEYIQRGDELAMEPLLSLLSHFAHDLDSRFEKHFQRAVATITAVAAKHEDFAVIEWSFTCLAWLFKYLSRLLTPNLRPLYDLMASYLGKEKQRPFVVRFTAESLSFLVRKAAVSYERDQEPLEIIINHMLDDCTANVDCQHSDLLQQGLMTLLTDAIKGVQHGIHTGGIPVLKTACNYAVKTQGSEYAVTEAILTGTLTSLIHACDKDGFKPILDFLTTLATETSTLPSPSGIRLSSSLLFTAVSVRKGSRITEWKTVVEVLKALVNACEELEPVDADIAEAVLGFVAVTMQTSSVNAVLSTNKALDQLRTGRLAPYFSSFCDMSLRLGTERFDQFILPSLQRHILQSAERLDPNTLTLVSKIGDTKPALKLQCSKLLINSFLVKLSEVANQEQSLSDDGLADCNLFLAATPFLVLDRNQTQRLESALLSVLEWCLRPEAEVSQLFMNFGLGRALHDLVLSNTETSNLERLWIGLCNVSSKLVALPSFWSNLLQLLQRCKPGELSGDHITTLEGSLVSCLCLPSHAIRRDALDILQELYRARNLDVPNILSVAILIESIPVSLETSRSISMNIRRLPMEYTDLPEGDLMLQALPTYCFGLLHLKLAQAWEDATAALASICESKAGEEFVVTLAQSWIDGKVDSNQDSLEEVAPIVDVNTDGFKVFSDFECPNLAKLFAIRRQVFGEPSGGLPSPQEKLLFDQRHAALSSETSRTQALMALNKIPQVAEKRSRLLVPILLRWALSQNDSEEYTRWNRKDQKALLGVFAQFVNPKVLYKSAEVYDALLALCANGDVDIQKSALQAILAWKDTSVTSYEEHLLNILDEARFREEVSIFLKEATMDDDDNEGIRAEDNARVMPILLRLLYGRTISGGKEGQSGRRKAIFVALSRFGESTMEEFLSIAFSSTFEDSALHGITSLPKATLRQQLGLVNMVSDMLEILGADLQPFVIKILNGVLTSTISAAQKLETGETDDQSLLRSIRQTGMQCIVKVFASMGGFRDNQSYGKTVVDRILAPRMPAFASENAQSVSSSLRLLAAWSSHRETALIFSNNKPALLEEVAALLRSPHAKDEVRLFILRDILEPLLDDNIEQAVLQPHVSNFVKAIGNVLVQQPSKEVLDACVVVFSRTAGRIASSEEAVHVVKVCTELLKRPSSAVTPRTKAGLLQTILPLIQNFNIEDRNDLYTALCALYSRLSDPESRVLLSKVLISLAQDDIYLLEIAKTCDDMNAMGSRLDEPDHEGRERAFAKVYDSAKQFTLHQWLPVVHNCLFFIRDNVDRVNRSSSSHALQLFVAAAAQHPSEPEWQSLVESALIPSIEKTMQDRRSTELVLAEYLIVLGHIVEKFSAWEKVNSMQVLTVGGDEEASFFMNVLHIQQHRRLRALRRLSDDATTLASSNVSKILLPLLEHFVFDPAEGDAGRTLADQAVQTIGALAGVMNKSAFRATFQRFSSHLKKRDDDDEEGVAEKKALRILGAMVDNLQHEQTSPAIVREMLPPLFAYLHRKDESTVDRRMPIAVTIVKLMKSTLPEEEFASRLPAVLTDISHVLRSRSQEARDQTRKALTTISSLVGATYFSFILRELRGALKRGYQLHVLSFTVHSLLVSAEFQPGDLDECYTDLMLVIMDDIFGVTGQEKDAEEYRSGMKEVKSSKSFDTMELLANITPIKKLGQLVRPIRNLLSERVDMKMVKKIDDLLARLRKGLDQNEESDSRDMLSFCWEIVNQVYAEESAALLPSSEIDERRKRHLIQPEPEAKKKHAKGTTTSYRFKLISFALNLLRKIVRRHEDLQTPGNMAGFLPMAGDALVQGLEEVKLSAMRLLSTIMRVPLKQLELNAPMYVKEAINLLKGAVSMSTDSSKASLELITSVLREKRTVEVKERDIALVLKRVKNDIDEPDRQVMTYKFLRAVLGRKIVITEVYEVMDEVGKAMVTNPDRSVRDSARGAYLQFVMEYPQGKDRWEKQTKFLVGNLKYEHASGRQSVMEFLHQMLNKVGDDVIEDHTLRIFASLNFSLVGDSDHSCQEMAKVLIGRLFERASDERLKAKNGFLATMGVWMRSSKPVVKAASLQCWSILLRNRRLPSDSIVSLRDEIEDTIMDCSKEDAIVDPKVALEAIRTFAVIVECAPAVAFSPSSDVWSGLQKFETTGDAAIDETVASLLGALYNNIASTVTVDGLSGLPLRGSGGIELGAEDMRSNTLRGLKALRAVNLHSSETLTTQIVRNLVFLGRCFAANEMPWRISASGTAEEEEDDDEEGENGDSFSDEEQRPLESIITTRAEESALAHLLRRLSSMVMADKFYIVARSASLTCTSSLINQLSSIPNLFFVLRPLYSLTDPSVPKPPGEQMKAMIDKAAELLDQIQKKVGAETYISTLATVRKEAKGRREERRQKRKFGAVSLPERAAKEKKRKHEIKKERIKERGREARGMRRGW